MKKSLFIIIALVLAAFNGFSGIKGDPKPDEGMWVPLMFENNYEQMKALGLKLTREQIYSINNSSLKDAIVGLSNGTPGGFFCTGEIVSDKGLIFTNHHCGYAAIQEHSNVDHDYLTDGFWAMSFKEELTNPGMTASFLIRIDDVTKKVLEGVTDESTPEERSKLIRAKIGDLKKEAGESGKYDIDIKPFYGGSEYYMYIYQTYKDVRLVGAPPSSIGKFGGDTDNWMWPRHTGDFCIFRVYSAPDGSPAEYSEKNIPLKPKHHLPVSIKGVEKNDFTMIWGFPGNTERYLTSFGVQFALDKKNPTIIDVFGKVLENMKTFMDQDDKIRIQLAADYASLANTWKYFIGQTRGIKRLDLIDQKMKIEEDFTKWAKGTPERQKKYGDVLKTIQDGYKDMEGIIIPFYYTAIGSNQLGIANYAQQFMSFETLLEKPKDNKEAINLASKEISDDVDKHFAEYIKPMDMNLTRDLLKMFKKNIPKEQLPDIFATIDKKFDGCIDTYVENLFAKSFLTTKEATLAFLKKPSQKKLNNDPGMQMTKSFMGYMMQNQGGFQASQTKVNRAMRSFIAGLREMNPGKVYYPDANSTMRYTYGQVLDYVPGDAMHYDYATTSKGILEKEDPANEEFIVSPKLKDLLLKKDFGRYGKNGVLNTCFLHNTDITGGNSGSPVINADGELIGIAFDGNWEAMSGDIAFEPTVQRTISVDIRYVLFVIDKYAGAKNLINELTIRD